MKKEISQELIQALEELRNTSQQIEDAIAWVMEDPENRAGMGVGPNVLAMDCDLKRAVKAVLEHFDFVETSVYPAPWPAKRFELKKCLEFEGKKILY